MLINQRLCHYSKKLCCILLLLWLSMHHVQAKEEPPTLSFGIVPQQSASTLARVWNPILQYLSQQTGLRIVFRTAPDIPTFEQRLAEGQYDIAYMNPYHYTVVHEQPGYEAFAKAKNKTLKGVLVVRKGADIPDLKALDGSTLAFPAPAAFAASVLPRAQLQQEGIKFTPKYVSSHDSVYRAVAKGLYPAGGGVMRTFNSVDKSIKDQLEILWTTRSYTSHAIAAHPRIPKETLVAVTEALLKIDQSFEDGELLNALSIKGFEAAQDSRWNDIRELNIELPTGIKEKGF